MKKLNSSEFRQMFLDFFHEHGLCAIVSVYVAGSLLEFLRQHTFGRLWETMTDRLFVPLWNRLAGFVHGQLQRQGIE